MGQKVHPIGIRLGFIKGWNSSWYSDTKEYANKLNTDINIRSYLYKKFSKAYVSNIKIERPAKNAKIIIYTSRPGIIIGKKGEEVEALRDILSLKMKVPVQINIEEIKKPELNARLIAESISRQLEKRIAYRRVMKRSIQVAMKMGAKGIKISIAGRVQGAEIARTESSKEGRIPLHTFRANIDYALSEALTVYGILGVKVWVFLGEVMSAKNNINVPKKNKFYNKKRKDVK